MDSRNTSRNQRRNNRPSGGGGQHRNNRNNNKNQNNKNSGRRSNRSRNNFKRRPSKSKIIERGASNPKERIKLPELGSNIRIMPLGGVEQVGRNMTAIEVGNDIIIIDMGFQFKTDETPGIDYILPNVRYLEENKDRIRGVVITHGHLDHIGAIPYIINRIGNPTIYSRLLTTVMIQKRQEEFPQQPKLNLRNVEANESLTLGNLKVRFFSVTHTIPESMGIIIETPQGLIVNTGDTKLDHVDGVPTAEEVEAYSVFKDQKVLALIADSTNVEKPGWSIPEWKVHENLEKIISETKGRLIIGTFASQIERILKIVEIAETHNKKVVVEGRSMKQNMEIIKHLNILNAKKDTFISADQMDNYPPDRILALATGAQGDEFAALMRMSMRTHKYFKLTPRDTILLSSSIIPGNENSVQKLKDNLARQGVNIIHYRVSDVHSSGHANQEEVRWIHEQIKPKFFIPVHGHHYMLHVHAKLAEEIGVPRENIVIPQNGSVIEIQDNASKITALKQTLPSDPILVDGFSVGSMQDVVIRDRQMLSEDGMFVIVASVNPKTGKLRKSPDIISRGFVYLRESQHLLRETREIIRETIEKATKNMQPIDFEILKNEVSDNVSRHLFQKTAKHPIIIPVMIGV